MKHPLSRAQRRRNGEVWRDRQRRNMLSWWSSYRFGSQDPTCNNMWWARKQCTGHGNRCMCHYGKRTEVTKRRRALKRMGIEAACERD